MADRPVLLRATKIDGGSIWIELGSSAEAAEVIDRLHQEIKPASLDAWGKLTRDEVGGLATTPPAFGFAAGGGA